MQSGWVHKDRLTITNSIEILRARGEIDERFFQCCTVRAKWRRDRFPDNIYKVKRHLSRHGVALGSIESIRDFVRLSYQIRPAQIFLDVKESWQGTEKFCEGIKHESLLYVTENIRKKDNVHYQSSDACLKWFVRYFLCPGHPVPDPICFPLRSRPSPSA